VNKRILTIEEAKAIYEKDGCSYYYYPERQIKLLEAQDAKSRKMIFTELKKYCQNEYERLSLHDLETIENEV
jgi:hypothetical protein